MPRTYDSQRLRIQQQVEQRLDAEHATLARAIIGLVLRSATGRNAEGVPIIPLSLTARDALKMAIWAQVLKPFYIGNGIEPLLGTQPQSPYTRLMVESIAAVTRVQVARQTAIVTGALATRAPDVVRWLTGPRPLRINELSAQYDPFHRFVDPNGYRLSDRIWRTSIDVRSRVDRLLDYHISRGTSAVDIADLLEPFLTRGGLRSRTVTPYGTEGSYSARRLARTEITAASGRATVNSSVANPFVTGVRWVLSRSHRDIDECDYNARGGPNGDGIYAPDDVPTYPNHPNELCTLAPVATGSVSDLIDDMRVDIVAGRNALQGILNVEWLTQAIMAGFLDESLARVSPVGSRDFPSER